MRNQLGTDRHLGSMNRMPVIVFLEAWEDYCKGRISTDTFLKAAKEAWTKSGRGV